MTKPITPAEVVTAKAAALPDGVLETFNDLIAKKWNGYSATLKIGEVCKALRLKMNLTEGVDALPGEWLDIEPVYRKAGWYCEFDKPGYNETYEGYYTFKKKP